MRGIGSEGIILDVGSEGLKMVGLNGFVYRFEIIWHAL